MAKARLVHTLLISGALLIPHLSGSADDPLDAEMAQVLEKVKSSDQAERAAAVRELLGLREAVSRELRRIVEDVGEGHLGDGPKASALHMMGKLRLAQCADILKRERNWQWDWRTDPYWKNHRMVWRTRTLLLPVWQRSMVEGLFQSARCPDTVTLLAGRPGDSVENYPALRRALSGLRSARWEERCDHEDSVLHWYDMIYGSINSVLDPSRAGVADVYGNEVKATAAYVLGEYRIPHAFSRIRNVDLRDEKGVCGHFAQTLTVRTSEPAYPCVVALIKSGYPGTIHSCLDRIADSPELAQETRDRLARVIVAIDPSEARKIFHAKVERYETDEMLVMQREEKLRRVRLLRTIGRIVEGARSPLF